jgi:cytoskeleton protein RodZ
VTISEPSTGTTPAGDETVGAALRAAREAAGLTVDQVSQATRIRAALVRDLEADRLDSSGGAVYARGHVRALAHAIGVDPCPFVERLDRALGETPRPVESRVSVDVPRRVTAIGPVPVEAAPERRSPRWAAAGVVAAAVLAALFVVGSVLDDRGDARDSVQLLTAPAPEQPAPDAAAPAPAPVPPAPTGAELVLSVSGGASWISVSSPTQLLFEGEVADGWAETFRDEGQLRLRVGNAAAVQVICAGAAPSPAGARGQVMTLVCAPSGLSPA